MIWGTMCQGSRRQERVVVLGLVKERRQGEVIKDRKLEGLWSLVLKVDRLQCEGVCPKGGLRTPLVSLFRYIFLVSKLPILSIVLNWKKKKWEPGVCYLLVFSFYLEQWSLICIWYENVAVVKWLVIAACQNSIFCCFEDLLLRLIRIESPFFFLFLCRDHNRHEVSLGLYVNLKECLIRRPEEFLESCFEFIVVLFCTTFKMSCACFMDARIKCRDKESEMEKLFFDGMQSTENSCILLSWLMAVVFSGIR